MKIISRFINLKGITKKIRKLRQFIYNMNLDNLTITKSELHIDPTSQDIAISI